MLRKIARYDNGKANYECDAPKEVPVNFLGALADIGTVNLALQSAVDQKRSAKRRKGGTLPNA